MTSLPGRLEEYLLRAGQGDRLITTVGGDNITLKSTGAENEGRVAFVEYVCQPGSEGPPPHAHEGHEELFYVVEGSLNMLVGDQIIVCHEGDFAFAPRYRAHTFWNESATPCKFVATFSPAGFERIFEHFDARIAEGDPLSPEEAHEIHLRYGMEIVDWPPHRWDPKP